QNKALSLSPPDFCNSAFKSMKTAYATIKEIEVMRALRKGQASAFYYGAPQGEMRLVSRVFDM
ncbi:hypothetical protein AMA11_25010, partial [Salmonella enterica subsp. enterica serovar Muenchen]|nr:hypothetical protein [Salmonella enterica subsp. enterica serovar Muenchen]